MGFDGIVLRFSGKRIVQTGNRLAVEAGAVLQAVVDMSGSLGLSGIETMTGIPGYLGGAIYGNAGAYGQSIQERVESVLATDGEEVRPFDNAECEFRYRDSWFKSHKEWVILSAQLAFEEGDAGGVAKGVAGDSRDSRQEVSANHEMCGKHFQESILRRVAARCTG